MLYDVQASFTRPCTSSQALNSSPVRFWRLSPKRAPLVQGGHELRLVQAFCMRFWLLPIENASGIWADLALCIVILAGFWVKPIISHSLQPYPVLNPSSTCSLTSYFTFIHYKNVGCCASSQLQSQPHKHQLNPISQSDRSKSSLSGCVLQIPAICRTGRLIATNLRIYI